jgi:16S rRNA (uracil1498-N3)-methyltransferase
MSRLPRFYCPRLPEPSDSPAGDATQPLPLEPDEARHARKVLRLGEGDKLELFDGRGCFAQARVVQAPGREGLSVEPVDFWRLPPNRPKLIVVAPIPKGDRAEQLIDQLSQVGADTLHPLTSRYSVVDPREAKLQRLKRRCIEAAKQCRRGYLLSIGAVVSLEEALTFDVDTALWADLDRAEPADLPARLARARRVSLIVGPEGGFSDEERDRLERSRSTLPWGLGPHVMRLETAAAAGAAVLRYLARHRDSTPGSGLKAEPPDLDGLH